MKRAKLFSTLMLAGLLVVGLFAAPALSADSIKLATTTSTYNSGLLDYLLPEFTADTGVEVEIISVGTGKALELGRNGDVDVVLVHARPSEDEYMAGGYGTVRKDVMYNDFIIIGPADDPAGISGLSVVEAMKKIAETESLFVSRGDDSGTHKKELILWNEAGVTPDGKWYMEAGQGMGAVLVMAFEQGGYTMTDRGTYIAYVADGKTDQPILVEGDPILFNPYGIMDVNPELHPTVNHDGAMALIDWMTSEKGQTLIGDFRLQDKVLFYPSAGE
ncbi:MAG: substrate-binding domain-containing protein [Deltaproteobacteria bacterium]|nr:substrate-binding domain-containing protein [Candidatus Zymogenaceae bacterium]